MHTAYMQYRGGCRIFEGGGVIQLIRSPRKWGGSSFGPNVKKPMSCTKGGGPDPMIPPGSATVSKCLVVLRPVGRAKSMFRVRTYNLHTIYLQLKLMVYMTDIGPTYIILIDNSGFLI